MKSSKILCAITLFLFTSSAFAFDLFSEIRGGSYCKTEVFDRFKLIEKTQHKMLSFRPSNELMSYAESMELMCPWSMQRDFNGDEIQDWVGFAKIENRFELVAYISDKRNYSVQILKTLDKLPKNIFLRWLQTKSLKKFTKKKLQIGGIKYALQIATFGKTNDIYLWNGKELSKILTTPQLF